MTPTEVKSRLNDRTTPVTLRGRADLYLSLIPDRDPEKCWVWPLDRGARYSRVSIGNRQMKAHRLIYDALVGPIPDRLTLDHLCRNTHCVNPAHLEPVTEKVNILRGAGPPALNARKTHCNHGHPLTGENLRPHADGKRRCRACQKVAWQLKNTRRREATRQARLSRSS